MKIAVIPARGGSKRIPRKNIKPFFGKPMIAWSIQAAQESGLFDKIVVSTEDDEISAVAKSWGADTPFLRPKNLADDFTGTVDVIAHAIDWGREQGWDIDAVCCLYATAPFVDSKYLAKAFRALNTGNWDYVFAATEYAAPIFRSLQINEKGSVSMFFPEHYDTRSQDLISAYHDAGQFYWGKPESWIERKAVFGGNSKAILIPRWKVQDIDTSADWDRAELIAPLILNKNE